MQSSEVALLLGANLGDATRTFEQAKLQLSSFCTLLAESSLWITQPWGVHDQPDFTNQALLIRCSLSPESLLDRLQEIEALFGRTGKGLCQPRTLDIDILLMGQTIKESSRLTIPHPRLRIRRFALAPLSEIIPDALEPVSGRRISELLEQCSDPLKVWKSP